MASLAEMSAMESSKEHGVEGCVKSGVLTFPVSNTVSRTSRDGFELILKVLKNGNCTSINVSRLLSTWCSPKEEGYISKEDTRQYIRYINTLSLVQTWLEMVLCQGNVYQRIQQGPMFTNNGVRFLQPGVDARLPNAVSTCFKSFSRVPQFGSFKSNLDRIDSCLKLERPLYCHQKEALAWALGCEDPSTRFPVTSCVKVGNDSSSFYFETSNGHRHLSKTERPFSKGFVSFSGGILGDSPGTGKTAVVLSMVISTWEGPPKAMKRTPGGYWSTNATLLVVPPQLVRQVHEEILSMVGSSGMKNVIFITTVGHQRSLRLRDLVEAQLVVVTENIVKHDNSMAHDQDKFNEMRLYAFYNGMGSARETKETFEKKNRKKRNMNARPSSMAPAMRKRIRGKRMQLGACKKGQEWTMHLPVNDQQGQGDVSVYKEDRIMDFRAPSLWMMRWKRLVLDEAHEYMCTDPVSARNKTAQRMLHHILRLNAQFRWYVSGTPFPKDLDTVFALLSFLDVRFSNPMHEATMSNQRFCLSQSILMMQLQRYIVCRRSKDAVMGMSNLDMGTVYRTVQWVDLSQQERKMYELENLSEIERRQICSHPLLNLKVRQAVGLSPIDQWIPLEEVSDLLCKDLQKKMDDFKRKVFVASHLANSLVGTARFEEAAEQLKALEKQHEEVCSKVAYMKKRPTKLIQDLASGSAECSICVMAQKHSRIAVLPCGHATCTDCMELQVKHSGRCGVCRAPASAKSISYVSVPTASQTKEQSEFDSVRSTSGSKMAHLLLRVRKILDEDASHKVLVFSTWHLMLKGVYEVFKGAGIYSERCRGSAEARIAALARFKAGKRRVLLLSLEDAASGSNLQQASHIIFVDVADSGEGESREWQAVSRVHRMGNEKKRIEVVHMVVRETVEERLFRKRHNELATISENPQESAEALVEKNR